MVFIFPKPMLIRHLWQLKAVVFLHWYIICAVLLLDISPGLKFVSKGPREPLTVHHSRGWLMTLISYPCISSALPDTFALVYSFSTRGLGATYYTALQG